MGASGRTAHPAHPARCARPRRSPRTIAGGFGEAERSERGGGGRGGPKGRANPPRVPISMVLWERRTWPHRRRWGWAGEPGSRAYRTLDRRSLPGSRHRHRTCERNSDAPTHSARSRRMVQERKSSARRPRRSHRTGIGRWYGIRRRCLEGCCRFQRCQERCQEECCRFQWGTSGRKNGRKWIPDRSCRRTRPPCNSPRAGTDRRCAFHLRRSRCWSGNHRRCSCRRQGPAGPRAGGSGERLYDSRRKYVPRIARQSTQDCPNQHGQEESQNQPGRGGALVAMAV